MTARTRGLTITAGGVAWLVGIFVLETTYVESDDGLPAEFLILALFAGLAAGWGLWSMARSLDNRLSRLGVRLVGLGTAAFGIGFGLDLLPFDVFVGFLLAYTFGLFVLPAGFLVFGVGVLTSEVFPRWARWVPLSVAAMAVVTYGFHALAREIWDPSDAVWFTSLGIGLVLLGLASLRVPTGPHGDAIAS